MKGEDKYNAHAGFEVLYSNWLGQPAIDTLDGGLLTNAIIKVMHDPDKIKKKEFSSLFKQISKEMNKKLQQMHANADKQGLKKQLPMQLAILQTTTFDEIYFRQADEY